MPRTPVETNDRLSIRIASDDKSLIMRASAIQHTNLTEFMVKNAVSVARSVIEKSERVDLTRNDSLHILDLLENPPKPNKKLLAAAYAMPKPR